MLPVLEKHFLWSFLLYIYDFKLQRVVCGKIFPLCFGILSAANGTADKRPYHILSLLSKEPNALVRLVPIPRTTASGQPFTPACAPVQCVTVLPKKIIQLTH